MSEPAFAPAPARRVVFLVLPGVHLLDLSGPAQVFDAATTLGARYELVYASPFAQVVSAQGLALTALGALPDIRPDDLVMVPGTDLESDGLEQFDFPGEALDWLRRADQSGAQLASICTGAAVLGEAGLLDGRRATTHHLLLDALRVLYPRAKVQEAVLYTFDGRVATSAGIASGLDLALALIERDCGPAFAARVARHLVVYLRRDGSQPQASAFLAGRAHLHLGVHRAQDLLAQRAGEKVKLADLARAAHMSPRGLSKAFRQHVGCTPLEYQQRLRLDLASQLLHDPTLTLEAIAERCGLDSARHLRRLWHDRFGRAPSESRAALPARPSGPMHLN